MGGHAVKLIGWGTSDTGEDYWVFETLQPSLSIFLSTTILRGCVLILCSLYCSLLQINGIEAGVTYVSVNILSRCLALVTISGFLCSNILHFELQDGYFKIRRGTNECSIEKDAVAGMPSKRNLVREVACADAAAHTSY